MKLGTVLQLLLFQPLIGMVVQGWTSSALLRCFLTLIGTAVQQWESSALLRYFCCEKLWHCDAGQGVHYSENYDPSRYGIAVLGT